MSIYSTPARRIRQKSGAAPKNECVKALKSPVARKAIADVINIVRRNDEQVLDCLREMMGD